MKRKDISKATAQAYETNKAIRRSWEELNPVTRVIPNKKKNRKIKHKGKELENYD